MSSDDSGDSRLPATVARLLADPALWAEVPSGLRERVLDAVATTDLATADPGPGQARHAVRSIRGARRHRRRQGALLAAAAVAVVCLGVAGGLRLVSDDAPPVRAEVALAGTEAAPAATATARLRDEPGGVSVALDVEGLEPAPDGTFYEAWLVGETGKVSAGTFHLRGDDDEIDLWLGVDPAVYDLVTVTRQPVEGGTAAEGVVVLRGELPPAP